MTMWLKHIFPSRDFSYTSLCLTVTWPYHRTLRHFTLDPAARLAKNFDNDGCLPDAVEQWKTKKTYELHFVCRAATVAAAAVIGIFSWNEVAQTFWVARALFYFSMSLSIWAVLASAQQFSVINALPKSTENAQLRQTALVILRGKGSQHSRKRKSFEELNMLYVWQVPLMLMSYGMVTLLVALTLHVCSPLIEWDEDGGKKVAIFYLGTGLMLFLNFVWSSACVYWTPEEAADVDVEAKPTMSNASTLKNDVADNSEKKMERRQTCEKLDMTQHI